MRDLTRGNLLKEMALFAVPIFAGNVLQQLYNVVDSIIIGKYLGKTALAAVGTAGAVFFILISIMIGMSIVAEMLISRKIGAEDDVAVKKIVNSIFVLIMGGSIIIGIIGLFFSVDFLKVINTPADIIPEASSYLKIIFAGLPGVAGYNTLKSFITSTGDSKKPLFYLLIASGLNIILDFAFIGWLSMGVEGAALATIIAQTFSFILCLAQLKKISPKIKLELKKKNIDFGLIKQGIRLGFPSAIQVASGGFAMIVVQGIVNGFDSTDIIAAYTIAIKVDMFVALPATSLGFAMITVISQNIGARQPNRVKLASISSRVFALCLGVVFSFVLFFLSDDIIQIFVSPNEREVIRYGALYVKTLSLVYPLATLFTIAHGITKGKGNMFVPMIISVVGNWAIRIPLVALFSEKLGFISVGGSVLVAWTFIFIATLIYEMSVRKRSTCN